jgi:hypothetical protein
MAHWIYQIGLVTNDRIGDSGKGTHCLSQDVILREPKNLIQPYKGLLQRSAQKVTVCGEKRFQAPFSMAVFSSSEIWETRVGELKKNKEG